MSRLQPAFGNPYKFEGAPQYGQLSSGTLTPSRTNANRAASDNASRDKLRERPAVQLGDVLRDSGAPRSVDCLSLDVEGAKAEELVLEAFPSSCWRLSPSGEGLPRAGGLPRAA
jgi:hypothetical protein